MTTTTGEVKPAAGKQTWKSVGRSAGVRLLVLPTSAILGIVITRLIVDNYGPAAYAQYGLLVTIGSLLPFADLGISAAIMNTIGGSDDPANDETVLRVLITSIRVLFVSAAVILLLSATITVIGGWPSLLGEGLDPVTGPMVAALCLAMIGITMPVGIGQRILTGLGRNHVMIGLMGLQSPLVLLVLLAVVNFHLGNGSFLPVVPYIATFVLTGIATLLAARAIRPAFGLAVRRAPKVRSEKGGKVFDVAWPMLIQMIALPLAMQTDRIVLSHVSDVADLAQYNLASQMYTPVWAVTSAAGFALWPIFAKARAKGERGQSPIPTALVFGGVAGLICLAITVVAPWLAEVASGGRITLPLPLLITFSLFMIVQALKYPLGMYMTDSRGLRYQAYMILVMVPVNVGLSIYLAERLGAVGPVIGSAIGVFCFQVVANYIYVRRDLRRRPVAPPVEIAAIESES